MKDCNQCGKCCIKYGGSNLSATLTEIDTWQEHYPHIFSYVADGEIWVDPSSGQQFEQCPWLRKEGVKYTCDIYDIRPDDCRQYPSLIDDMIRDACEMLESRDLRNRASAEAKLKTAALTQQN
ncbi:MAG: YkgJ family cysteine cluster protein [Acidiferrobacterales bacterium]|nr:YkgJ family cysteine cluster protein [Acidiferrobacterales bacterium]